MEMYECCWHSLTLNEQWIQQHQNFQLVVKTTILLHWNIVFWCVTVHSSTYSPKYNFTKHNRTTVVNLYQFWKHNFEARNNILADDTVLTLSIMFHWSQNRVREILYFMLCSIKLSRTCKKSLIDVPRGNTKSFGSRFKHLLPYLKPEQIPRC